MKATKTQIEKILLDEGVVYLNYGTAKETLLAPCRGGNKVEFEVEIRDIEMNSVPGKVKGSRRKILENAKMEVNFMDLSLENLKMALPGSKISGTTLKNGWDIKLSDYIDNVTLIVRNNDGATYRKITLFNCLVDEPISIETAKDDEVVLTVVFSAHYDPENPKDELWEMADITEVKAKG